jgi:lipopolysaccharide export system protein LptA
VRLLSLAALAVACPILAAGGQAQGSPTARSGPARSSAARAVPPTHVVADQIEYRYRERRTVMTGKPLVVLTRGDAVLVCRRLVADSDSAGDIRHAVCDGDVKLTRGDRIVTCARATYDGEEGRIVCRGEPVMRDGESVLRCDELVYDLDADRVTARQASGIVVRKPGQEVPRRRTGTSDVSASHYSGEGR